MVENEDGILPYKLYSYKNMENYPYLISRVSDNTYKIIVENEDDYGIGTFIDIYPIDYISNNRLIALIKGRFYSVISSLYFMSTRQRFISKHRGLKRFAHRILYSLSKLLGKLILVKLSFSNKPFTDNRPCRYVGCLQWMTSDFQRNVIDVELLTGRSYLEFEGQNFKVPKNYEQLLAYYYGDYLARPKVEDQVAHHGYNAYKR